MLTSPLTPSLLASEPANSANDQAVEQLFAGGLASALELLLDQQTDDASTIDFSDATELDDADLMVAGSFAVELDAALEDAWQGV
jgi:hypothetical protein